MIALLLLGLAPFASYADESGDYYACTQDSECILARTGECFQWEAINKKVGNTEKYANSRNAALKCRPSSDPKPASAVCKQNKCDASADLNAEFYRCNHDSDCTVIAGPCHSWTAVNKVKAKDAEIYLRREDYKLECAPPGEKPLVTQCKSSVCAIDLFQDIEDSCHKHTGTNQSWGWCQCVAMKVDTSDILAVTKHILIKKFPDGPPSVEMKVPDSIVVKEADKLRTIFNGCIYQTTNFIEKK